MKCLVTGGAGFIGSHICEYLCTKGHEVVCIDNLVEGSLSNLQGWWRPDRCTFVHASVYEFDTILPFFEGVDLVFHNAASKCLVCRDDPKEDLMTNSRGAWCVFEASRLNHVKHVIYASTGSVNEGSPKSFYGVSKYSAENYLKAFQCYYSDFHYSILRYHHVYGTRQTTLGVIPNFILKVLNDQPVVIEGSGLQERRFTYVGDVVAANMAVIDGDHRVYNVISDYTLSIKDLAYKVYQVLAGTPNIQYVDGRPDDVMKFDKVQNDRIKDLGVGFNTVFDEKLREVIEWIRCEKSC